jgi:pimeloyl-ACP methyl ester carboxylesterase
VRNQKLGFITKWGKVVAPVVDYLETSPEVDMTKVGLVGLSMGGFLCVRAAAFEHRLAAVIAIAGVYDVADGFLNSGGPERRKTIEAVDLETAELMFRDMLANQHVPVEVRWGIEQGLWNFQTDSIAEFMGQGDTYGTQGVGE